MDFPQDIVESTALEASQSWLPPPTNTRKKKAPTLRESDWKPHKDRIIELYASGMTLEEVKETIEHGNDFRAEPRQYKYRINKWNEDKNIKNREMKCIVRKRQQRRLVETDKRELVFAIRNKPVLVAKIERWMASNNVPYSMLYSPISRPSTPSAVGCHTISERGSPAPSYDHAPESSVNLAEGLAVLHLTRITYDELVNLTTKHMLEITESPPAVRTLRDAITLILPEMLENAQESTSSTRLDAFGSGSAMMFHLWTTIDSHGVFTAEIYWKVSTIPTVVKDMSDRFWDPEAVAICLANLSAWQSRPTSTVSCIAYQILFEQFINSDAYQQPREITEVFDE